MKIENIDLEVKFAETNQEYQKFRDCIKSMSDLGLELSIKDIEKDITLFTTCKSGNYIYGETINFAPKNLTKETQAILDVFKAIIQYRNTIE